MGEMPLEDDRPRLALDEDPAARVSEVRAAAARTREAEVEEEGPQSEVRRITRPEMGAIAGDEGWASRVAGMPVVVMPLDLLKRLPLDHRDGFLLSLMDGAIDLETIVEIAGMPRGEVIRLVRALFQAGVIDFRTCR
jgi:hypothetical protein